MYKCNFSAFLPNIKCDLNSRKFAGQFALDDCKNQVSTHLREIGIQYINNATRDKLNYEEILEKDLILYRTFGSIGFVKTEHFKSFIICGNHRHKLGTGFRGNVFCNYNIANHTVNNVVCNAVCTKKLSLVNALKLIKIIKYNDLESPPNFYQVGAGLCRKPSHMLIMDFAREPRGFERGLNIDCETKPVLFPCGNFSAASTH
jgi:hypothetical protein